jgi:arylsulfatase A-like enzyme
MRRMKALWAAAASMGALSMVLAQTAAGQPAAPQVAAQAAKPWRYFPNPPRAPQNAPNVLLIMTDDVGFAASSTFGGPVPTPTFENLAAHGLRYNNFHTTAMCSPTRAALLTGRNHHSVGTGMLTNVATDDAGYYAVLPPSAATIGRVLQLNGYSTSWFGKNHNTPAWENTPVGPYDHWPNAMGFDYFFGFNSALADQFAPALIENRNPVDPARTPDYILDKDMADHALNWLHAQHTVAPDKPFFLYYAPGSAHSPHQAPKAWIDKFKGRFDQGYDKVREETFARQKAMGIIPANAELTRRDPRIPAWSSLSADEKKVSARLMEVHAAQLAYCDDQIGRIVEDLRRTGQLDNTLVMFLQGDNGASGEDFFGTRNDLAAIAGIEGDVADMLKHIDDLGGPRSFENYGAGWAFAMDTPFPWSKEIASHLGGMTNGMVISWPRRINGHGEVRPQFHHVIDVAPTIYEAVGIKAPAEVDRVPQQPLEGVSMVYSFDHGEAPSAHASQYFELLGNRAFYKDGWIASTTPGRMPWVHSGTGTNDALSYKWELYDLRSDFSQARDLAAKRPDKLKELQADFDAAAERYHVLPLNDDFFGRLNPALRPSLMAGRRSVTYYPGETRYADSAAPPAGRTWRLTATVVASDRPAEGTIAARGGRFGGWSLLAQGGRPAFVFRAAEQDGDVTRVDAPALTPGRHDIQVEFRPAPDVGPRAARVVMKIDGQPAGSGTIARTGVAGGEFYVGRAGLTPVSEDLPLPYRYNGVIEKVTIEPNIP